MSRGILSWGDFVLGGILSRGILSGGFCPGGFCPGGFCPDTSGTISRNQEHNPKFCFLWSWCCSVESATEIILWTIMPPPLAHFVSQFTASLRSPMLLNQQQKSSYGPLCLPLLLTSFAIHCLAALPNALELEQKSSYGPLCLPLLLTSFRNSLPRCDPQCSGISNRNHLMDHNASPSCSLRFAIHCLTHFVPSPMQSQGPRAGTSSINNLMDHYASPSCFTSFAIHCLAALPNAIFP